MQLFHNFIVIIVILCNSLKNISEVWPVEITGAGLCLSANVSSGVLIGAGVEHNVGTVDR